MSCGATANDSDGINCDDADAVGTETLVGFNEIRWGEIHMKKSNQVKTLICLQKQCCVGKKPLNIYSNTRFTQRTSLFLYLISHIFVNVGSRSIDAT